MNQHTNYTHPELVQLARFLRSQTTTVPEEVRGKMQEMINVHSFTRAQKQFIADHANRWSQRSKVAVRSILIANIPSASHVN